jgi:hypothetical protein
MLIIILYQANICITIGATHVTISHFRERARMALYYAYDNYFVELKYIYKKIKKPFSGSA